MSRWKVTEAELITLKHVLIVRSLAVTVPSLTVFSPTPATPEGTWILAKRRGDPDGQSAAAVKPTLHQCELTGALKQTGTPPLL